MVVMVMLMMMIIIIIFPPEKMTLPTPLFIKKKVDCLHLMKVEGKAEDCLFSCSSQNRHSVCFGFTDQFMVSLA
jgi:hypothetical protein